MLNQDHYYQLKQRWVNNRHPYVQGRTQEIQLWGALCKRNIKEMAKCVKK